MNDLTINNQRLTLMDIRMDEKRFPRLRQYSREDAIIRMVRIVSQAFLYKGHTADATNIQFIATTLTDELLSGKYGTDNLTFEEIGYVVKRAILDTDMGSISVSSLYRVIMEFVKGEGRENHKKELDIKEKREHEERMKQLSPMLGVFTGKMLQNTKV